MRPQPAGGVAARVAAVRARIAGAARRAGRDPGSVTLVAVGKTFPPEVLAEAVAAGVTDLGENRAQELAHKAAVLGPGVRWHFVGHLQTNKVRQVVGVAALVHSLDRPALADALQRRAEALGVVQPVLVEVNVAGEPSKHGVEPQRAVALARAAAELGNLEVRGLMTVPPLPSTPEDSRPHYRLLARLRDELAAHLPGATELSMGMTRDFEVAIEEGATIVRVGEGVFGPRR